MASAPRPHPPAAHQFHSATPNGVPACSNPANSCWTHGELPAGTAFASPNRHSQFAFQTDGNLVDYDENNNPRWAANTEPYGAYCIFQDDGNLVVYDAFNKPLWSSDTWSYPNDYLVTQGDGNVVIYNPGDRVLWATHTNH